MIEGSSREETAVVNRDLNPVFNCYMNFVEKVKLLDREMQFDIEDFDKGLIKNSYDPVGHVGFVF